MAETLGYRCPFCGGDLQFDSDKQKMFCKFCDNEFEVDELSKKDEELDNKEKTNSWTEDELTGMYVYRCSHCGGEVVGDETLGATTCAFCDMPVVMVEQFKGDLKPEKIIPFKLKKDMAVKQLEQFCKGKKLLPNAFTQNNRIESIKGMYVPYWLFDCKTTSRNSYTGTKTSSWTDSKYHYTKTDYYNVERAGSVSFDNVPMDGSKKLDDTYMQSIEPFDYKDMVEFKSAYMAGYLADRYDVSDVEAQKTVTERVTTTIKELMLNEARRDYSSCTLTGADIHNDYTERQYVLFPVWILSTNYKGEIYTFMMNGQTGKFVGKLPIDKRKYFKYFMSYSGITAVIVFLLSLLTMFI